MKKYISAALAILMLVSAMTFVACGKKHTIDTDINVDGESVSGKAGVVYETVTDASGEKVTDAKGEAVTVAVTVPAEGSTTADSGKDSTTKKNETTTAKSDTTTKKNETTTKKNETTTKKNETTTKKAETTTKKQETTTKKPEPTTAAPTTAAPTTAAPVVEIKDGEYVLTLSTDKTTVKPGDTLTVTLNLKNCKNVKSFGFELRAQGSLTATGQNNKKNMSADGLYMEINTAPAEGALIGGYFSDSYSFDNYDLCTITYQVASDAAKGETLVLSAVPTQMMVGSGNGGGLEYADAMKIPYLYVNVTD